MQTIQIDDEVYAALLKSVTDFGETPNSVLRKLLNIAGAGGPSQSITRSPVQEFLESNEFRFSKGAVGRFLAILSWLYRQNINSFTVVEKIRGRGRLYFARSAEELERSGRSVNPKKIPESPYWVITTTPTILKQEILSQVMRALGCNSESIQAAIRAIAQ